MENICSNYYPNRIVECRHKDAPWMTNELKCDLKENTKIYRKFVKKKYELGYKQLLMEIMTETSHLIVSAKENCYKND